MLNFSSLCRVRRQVLQAQFSLWRCVRTATSQTTVEVEQSVGSTTKQRAIKPVRGMHDVLAETFRKQQFICDIFRGVATTYGFSEVLVLIIVI